MVAGWWRWRGGDGGGVTDLPLSIGGNRNQITFDRRRTGTVYG